MNSKNIHMYNYFTCFITGSVILVLELLAFRLLAPYFGNSIYVTGAIINSILLALAIGYILGGYIADRVKSQKLLYSIILIASFYLFVAYFTYPTLLKSFSKLSVIFGSLISVIVLFFLPTVLLSFVPPYLIKILTTKNKVGVTSGKIFSISTIGSITGGLLTTFVFIPYIGSKITFFLSVLVLLLLGIFGLIKFRWFNLFLFFVFFIPFNLPQSKVNPDSLYETESEYNLISVTEYNGRRFLRLNDGGIHSVSLDPTTKLTGYSLDRYLFAYLLVQANKTLILGNGAGTMMSQVSYFFNTSIDGVEIDPMLTTVGEEYFNLSLDERKKVYHEDARVFLLKNKDKYDIIHVDMFSGSPYIPFHLATEEFFTLIYNTLSENGIMIANFIFPIDNTLGDFYLSTITKIFPNSFISGKVIYAFKSDKTMDKIKDIIKKKNVIDIRKKKVTGSLSEIATEALLELERVNINKKTFTDDHAPIEMLTYQVVKK